MERNTTYLASRNPMGCHTLSDLCEKKGNVSTKINVSKTQHIIMTGIDLDFFNFSSPTSDNYRKSFCDTDHKQCHPVCFSPILATQTQDRSRKSSNEQEKATEHIHGSRGAGEQDMTKMHTMIS